MRPFDDMNGYFSSLTTVDFLVSLEEVLLNETHVALTASEGSFT